VLKLIYSNVEFKKYSGVYTHLRGGKERGRKASSGEASGGAGRQSETREG